MHIESQLRLDYGDVLIRPKRSTLGSRAEVDINRTFRFVHAGGEWTGFPLIAANMDVTGTMAMARAFAPFRAMVALHKHYPAASLVEFFRGAEAEYTLYTLGTAPADYEKFQRVQAEVPLRMLNLDVANGYTQSFVDFVGRMRAEQPRAVIMAGVLTWSLATVACGFADSFAHLFVARVFVGIGAVGYALAALKFDPQYWPVAMAVGLLGAFAALLSDIYHERWMYYMMLARGYRWRIGAAAPALRLEEIRVAAKAAHREEFKRRFALHAAWHWLAVGISISGFAYAAMMIFAVVAKSK